MPILKRATAKLRGAGIPLEVHRGLWGYSLRDPRLHRQHGPVYPTPEDALLAALRGERPLAGPAADE